MSAHTDDGWMADAACNGADPEVFFPELGQSAAAAKAICGVCPVRERCLADAMAADVRHGVWGGLSPNERLALAGRRRRRDTERSSTQTTGPVRRRRGFTLIEGQPG